MGRNAKRQASEILKPISFHLLQWNSYLQFFVQHGRTETHLWPHARNFHKSSRKDGPRKAIGLLHLDSRICQELGNKTIPLTRVLLDLAYLQQVSIMSTWREEGTGRLRSQPHVFAFRRKRTSPRIWPRNVIVFLTKKSPKRANRRLDILLRVVLHPLLEVQHNWTSCFYLWAGVGGWAEERNPLASPCLILENTPLSV